jgi:hypothetical protein
VLRYLNIIQEQEQEQERKEDVLARPFSIDTPQPDGSSSDTEPKKIEEHFFASGKAHLLGLKTLSH